jgi:uncharacterized protein
MIFTPSSYTARRLRGRYSPFVFSVVIPLSIAALLFVSIGIYSFVGANRIMRVAPEGLDNFPGNILPSYANASFQSLDGLTTLSGWYFTTPGKPVSTVIMVHDHAGNRLQFGTDTVMLYDFFVEQGFNVLSFDLRHSGNSSGNISAFGYGEWQDVLGAIQYVKRVSSTTDVLLYGFGSGVAASLIAFSNLPTPNSELDDYPYNIQVLGFDQRYIRGLILDRPLVSPDDYIGAVCRNELMLGKQIGQHTIPYAVRLSAGNERKYNLAAILARVQLPVHLIHGNYPDDQLRERADIVVEERRRMFPGQTTFLYAEQSADEVFAATRDLTDGNGYLDALQNYLNRFILIAP